MPEDGSQFMGISGQYNIAQIINRIFLRPMMDKTANEIWKGMKPKLSYLHVFGSKCYILKDRQHFSKFDARSDEGLFLGYSMNSHIFRVFNKLTGIVWNK